MEKKTNDMLIIAATVLMLIMGIVIWKQNTMIKDYQQTIENTDTIVQTDTLFLEKEIKDSVPIVQYKKEIIRDTLYQKIGDSISATPQIITLIKKKSKTNWK